MKRQGISRDKLESMVDWKAVQATHEKNIAQAIKQKTFTVKHSGKTYLATYLPSQGVWEVSCDGMDVIRLSAVKVSKAKADLVYMLEN